VNLDISTQDGATVVTLLDRRLDAEGAPGLRSQIGALVDGGPRRLVMDMSRLRFLDSSGLGALVSTLRRTGGAVALVLPPGENAVTDVIRITRMHRVFDIYPTVAEAVKRVADV